MSSLFLGLESTTPSASRSMFCWYRMTSRYRVNPIKFTEKAFLYLTEVSLNSRINVFLSNEHRVTYVADVPASFSSSWKECAHRGYNIITVLPPAI